MLSSLMVLACGLLAFNIAGTYAADATIEDEIAKHLPPNETVPTISVQGIPWAMRSHELIPDVFDYGFEPKFDMEVRWKHHKKIHMMALLGNYIHRHYKLLMHRPKIKLSYGAAYDTSPMLCPENSQIIITASNADWPNHEQSPAEGELAVWAFRVRDGYTSRMEVIKVDDGRSIKQCADLTIHMSKVEEILRFFLPKPKKRSGRQRLIFTAFTPANGTTNKLHLTRTEPRNRWGMPSEHNFPRGPREWGKANGLVPIAVNYLWFERPLLPADD